MLNTEHAFVRLNLGKSSGEAVQMISRAIKEDSAPIAKAVKLIRDITGIERSYDDEDVARLTAMAIGDEAFKVNHVIDDVEAFVDKCEQRARKFRFDDNNAFHFVKPEPEVGATETVIAGIDVKVGVKADGKIKKGGKEILALELYKVHMLETKNPLTNQGFIAVLVKELGMSKAGATTYAYNCRKKLGEPAGGIVKAKKGRKAKVSP